MRLAIADPPYPPRFATRYDVPGGRTVARSRARRYYGDGTRSHNERPADFHPDAAEWDRPERHRELLDLLAAEFDGWAIATTPDGLAAYHPIPADARIMAWVKPNSQPSGHRIRSVWEPVIVMVPRERRSSDPGTVGDALVAATRRRRQFVGAKPELWTRWVLDALGYADGDTVTDLFPGSGAVSLAIANYQPPLGLIP